MKIKRKRETTTERPSPAMESELAAELAEQSKLTKRLRAYCTPGHSEYDPGLAAELRALRPELFPDKRSDK
jgi:hypothetical protein